MRNKNSFYFVPAIYITLLLFSVFSAEAQTSPAIVVKSAGFFINGKAVKMPAKSADIYDLLGRPDRKVEGLRRVSVWDKLGLIGYQPLDSEDFIEVAVILDNKTYVFPFTPEQAFVGSLTIDRAKVTAKSTRNSLNLAKTGVKFKPVAGVGMLSEMTTGELYLAMIQVEVLRNSGAGKIVHIAISQAKK